MKALLWTRYGPPELLQIGETDKPAPREDEVLVRVLAAGVNRTDCAAIRAKPFFMRLVTGLLKPKRLIPGTAFAGEVEQTGKQVSSLECGDRVFGFDDIDAGAHAEYLAISHDKVVTMPGNISYAQAAASSEGAHYAYNFINKVVLQKGQEVLVNGATGSIGTAAVQLLKYFGANVTAVCARKHIELVKALGAQRVIDYTREDFTRSERRFHYVFDTVGRSSFFKCRELLLPGGVYLSSDLGRLAQNIYLPLITRVIKIWIDGKTAVSPIPLDIRASLQLIQGLLKQGHYKPILDREYRFDQIIEAYRYVETGKKTGNVVITLE